jgi:hypothetical protein
LEDGVAASADQVVVDLVIDEFKYRCITSQMRPDNEAAGDEGVQDAIHSSEIDGGSAMLYGAEKLFDGGMARLREQRLHNKNALHSHAEVRLAEEALAFRKWRRRTRSGVHMCTSPDIGLTLADVHEQ